MRIRAAAAAALASFSVLSVGWLVGAPAVESLQATLTTTLTTPPSTAAASGAASGASGGASSTTDASAPVAEAPAAAAPAPAGVTGTFEGPTVQTRFGPMQVSVTIDNGTITEVTPLQLTNDDRKSVEISNRAAPVLRTEVLAAQSANVANVSGATYTTQGYLQSLQAALDAAQF